MNEAMNEAMNKAMNKNEISDDYKVGYKKPPEHTRFTSGQSGNPKGRKKGTKNLKTDLEQELAEYVNISENGKKTRLSKQRLMIKSLCAKAIKGDSKASMIVTNLILRFFKQAENEDENTNILIKDDEIINHFLQRQSQQND